MASPVLNSKQRQVAEAIKCIKDPRYFLVTYAKIQHPKRGLIPFKLYPFQEDCVQSFTDHRLNVVLKARQLGLSTVTAGYVAWLVLFHKHKSVLVIATKRATAMNFIKKVRTIVKNMPKWLMLTTVTRDNTQEIEFSHGSTVKAVPTSTDAGRSEGLSLLVIDEAAWIKGFDELWTGLYPTLSEGGNCIILSTPNGVGGQYHSLYTDAEQGLNDFNAIRLPWDVHPEHDSNWFEGQCRQLKTKKRIAQELLCDFVASGNTFLTSDDIEWVRTQVREPIDRQGFDKNIWIWSYALAEHKYLITADVARGDGLDYSTFHVLDMSTSEVVAEYKGRVPPDVFGTMLADIGKKYNNALVCPENNSFGYSTLVKLRELAYPRVYKKDSKAVYIVEYSPVGEDIALMGFNTNAKTRLQVLSKLEETIRSKQLRVYSARFYDELKTFVWTGQRAQALKGKNDDLIMSLAIATWLYDVSDGYSVHDAQLSNLILLGMSKDVSTVSDSVHLGKQSMLPPGAESISVAMPELDTMVVRNPTLRDDFDFSWVMKK